MHEVGAGDVCAGCVGVSAVCEFLAQQPLCKDRQVTRKYGYQGSFGMQGRVEVERFAGVGYLLGQCVWGALLGLDPILQYIVSCEAGPGGVCLCNIPLQKPACRSIMYSTASGWTHFLVSAMMTAHSAQVSTCVVGLHWVCVASQVESAYFF